MNSGQNHQLLVLMVDDDSEILSSVGLMFEFFLPEYRLVTTTSTADALRILRENPVDIVISDYRMPEMNGVDFLCRAREARPSAPRFLFTAYPDADVFERAHRDAEVRGVITKPCDAESFRTVLDAVRRQSLHASA